MHLKKVITNIIKTVCALLCSVGILSAFAMIYKYYPPQYDNAFGATDYRNQAYGIMSNMKEGHAWYRYDGNGYNNIIVDKEIVALLMGSSHMEARQIGASENTAALLNTYGLKTYNIGISAHDLIRCVANYKNALEIFHPSDYVIIETASIDIEMDKMREVLSGNYSKIKVSNHKSILSKIRDVPGIKLLYIAMKEFVMRDFRSNNTTAIQKYDEYEYQQTLTKFLSLLRDNAVYDVKIIIFYCPPEELKSDGTVSYITDESKLTIFKNVCKRLNITFVDMTTPFSNLYMKKSMLAHGFSNSKVGVGHLNKNGHKVVAQELLKRLREYN